MKCFVSGSVIQSAVLGRSETALLRHTVRHEAAKVAPNDAVPGGALPLIELSNEAIVSGISGLPVGMGQYRSLDVLRNVLKSQ